MPIDRFKQLKLAIGCILALGLTIQNFVLIDPISNMAFERFDTGKMYILETTSDTYETDMASEYVINNYQYTWIDNEYNTMLSKVDTMRICW